MPRSATKEIQPQLQDSSNTAQTTGLRVFIYGMQSSGASLVSFFLAQKQNTIAIIDLWNHCEAPYLEDAHDKDIVLKCVVTTAVPLETHLLNFKPDKKILVLRHPCFNYASLKNKDYGNQCGSVEEKFKILDSIFDQRDQFDLVIMYEDFIFSPNKVLKQIQEIGCDPNLDNFNFNRSKEEILNFNLQHSEWCKNFYKRRWNFGNIDFQKNTYELFKVFKYISLKDILTVRSLCPSLCDYYKENFHWDIYKVYIFSLSLCLTLLNDIKSCVSKNIKALTNPITS